MLASESKIMSVITKQLAKDFNTPELCEQCDQLAEIWWQLRVRQCERITRQDWESEQNTTTLNIGFCKHHALELALGVQRDVNEIDVGKKLADEAHLAVHSALSKR